MSGLVSSLFSILVTGAGGVFLKEEHPVVKSATTAIDIIHFFISHFP
jgi:hypothetical protein